MMAVMICFFFKQKTAYEITYGDWSSTCALPISGLHRHGRIVGEEEQPLHILRRIGRDRRGGGQESSGNEGDQRGPHGDISRDNAIGWSRPPPPSVSAWGRRRIGAAFPARS